MLTPFPVSPLETGYPILPLPDSMRVFLYQPTQSCLFAQAFPYTGALNTFRPKGLTSNLCPAKPSSATCELIGWWFSPWELWGGGLIGWYCYSSYGVSNCFSSFSPFFNCSSGDPVLNLMVGCWHWPCICQVLWTVLSRPLNPRENQNPSTHVGKKSSGWQTDANRMECWSDCNFSKQASDLYYRRKQGS
jgi:hypothetical protein